MAEIVIRHMQPADIPVLVEWMQTVELWQHYEMSRDRTEAAFQTALDRGHLLVVCDSTLPARGIAWCILNGVFGSYPYLKLLGVDPSFSNQGIGGQLLQHVEQHITNEGGQELFLLVSSGNLGAQRFYERHGYLQIGTIPELGGPKFTELLFRKQLVSLA